MSYTDKTGDIWRSTSAVQYGNGQIEEMTLAWEVNIAGTGDSRFALAQYISNAIITNLLPTVYVFATFLGTRISRLSTAIEYAGVIDPRSVKGTGGTSTAPTQCRIVSSLITDLSGRKYRGRSYGFTPDTTQVTPDGGPAAGLITAYTTFWQPFVPTITIAGTSWRLDVYHRPPKQKPPPPPNTGTGTPVSRVRVNNKLGTTRRSGQYGRQSNNPITQ